MMKQELSTRLRPHSRYVKYHLITFGVLSLIVVTTYLYGAIPVRQIGCSSASGCRAYDSMLYKRFYVMGKTHRYIIQDNHVYLTTMPIVSVMGINFADRKAGKLRLDGSLAKMNRFDAMPRIERETITFRGLDGENITVTSTSQ